MNRWMRFLGAVSISVIGAFGTIGCGGSGSNGRDDAESTPEQETLTQEAPGNRFHIDQVSLGHYGPNGMSFTKYFTEFAENPGKEWDLNGWDRGEEDLQTQSASTATDYLEVQFLDENGTVIGSYFPSDCESKVHEHEISLPAVEAIAFVAGKDSATLTAPSGEGTILRFTCWQAPYTVPTEELVEEPAMGSGDVNLSGNVNVSDVQLLAVYLNGGTTLNEEQMKEADVDGNGTIDEDDIDKLLIMAATANQ